MAAGRDLEYINRIRANGVLENGQPSFLRDWEPVRFLGKGSYGFVYEIRRGRERCAVKIIDMGAHPDVDYSVEINALSMLRGQKHATNIYEHAYVSINHSGFTDRYLLIRMNLLSDLPESMNEDEVIDMGAQLCEILSVCHGGETKIYHCDIKPENILVAKDGTYILADFGASNISQRSHKSSGHAGTPLFEAPEMLRFESFDGRSDIFSLGITMYSLLNNGLPPFAKNPNDADAIRIRLEGKKSVPAINGVSQELIKIIRKMCAPDADRRYRNAEELGKTLTALKDERDAKRRAAEEAKRRADEEAKRREEEAARRKAEQESKKRQKAESEAGNSVYGSTQAPGENRSSIAVKQTGRKPFGIIATAAALVAAIVCGVIFIPRSTPKPDTSGAVSKSDINITAEVSSGIPYLPEAADVSVGDHVTFGSYPQTEDGEVQPIEWRVLDVEDGNALMISEYLLDAKPYNEDRTDVTWEICTLRDWLNNDFYNAVFTAEEKSKIVQRTNDNPDNENYRTEGGNTTKDDVFCLSVDEARKYFSDDNDRMAVPTEYAIKRGAASFTSDNYKSNNGNKTGVWWLRSPGYYSDIAAIVFADGQCYFDSSGVHDASHCVRPVVSVSLSGEAQQTEQSPQQTSDLPALADLSISIGDHVTFGSYPQTEDGEVQPIEWRVLDIEDGKALMISEYMLDAKPYNETAADVTWDTCTLREWLNNDFYNEAFTAEEKSKIVQRTNENPDNPEYGTEGGNRTKDYVFCLSIDEVQKYFSNTKNQSGSYFDRMAALTAYTKKKGVLESSWGTGFWWLRSPGCNSQCAAYVPTDGNIDNTSVMVDDVVRCSVRPVILASL